MGSSIADQTHKSPDYRALDTKAQVSSHAVRLPSDRRAYLLNVPALCRFATFKALKLSFIVPPQLLKARFAIQGS